MNVEEVLKTWKETGEIIYHKDDGNKTETTIDMIEEKLGEIIYDSYIWESNKHEYADAKQDEILSKIEKSSRPTQVYLPDGKTLTVVTLPPNHGFHEYDKAIYRVTITEKTSIITPTLVKEVDGLALEWLRHQNKNKRLLLLTPKTTA